MPLLIYNLNLLDVETGDIAPNSSLLIEGERIKKVDQGSAPDINGDSVDGKNAYVMPGLIDAHVHCVITTMNFAVLRNKPEAVRILETANILKGILGRGFTTIRDAGGADFGIARAVSSGLIPGPRIFYAGRVLSQTGGHGDILEAAADHQVCACSAFTSWFSHVVDSPDAVRAAARLELKRGASQIKIMASGGVASVSDPLMSLQFTPEEMQAACDAASDWGAYTMAHAYSPDAITRAVTSGVRTIEHGNLLDEGSAQSMAKAGAYLVPTLVTYQGMKEAGARYGLGTYMQEKNEVVMRAGIESLSIAEKAGVPVGFGTDLLGELHPMQNQEFKIRSEKQSPLSIIQSATCINADIIKQKDQLGVIKEGAIADLLFLDSNPLDDIAVLAEPDKHIRMIYQAGQQVLLSG